MLQLLQRCALRAIERQMKQDDIFPLTVIRTRYSGVYEGGRYAAFATQYYDIPQAATGSDIPCSEWWAYNLHLVGIGNEINEAIENLIAKLQPIYSNTNLLGKILYHHVDDDDF